MTTENPERLAETIDRNPHRVSGDVVPMRSDDAAFGRRPSNPGSPRTPEDAVPDWQIDKLYAHDGWHNIATPEPVAAAWTALEAAAQRIEDYAQQWHDLDRAERTAAPAADAAAYQAMKAGKTPPASVDVVDNTAAKRAALANMAAAYRLAQEARRDYDRTVRRELPEWRQHLVESLPPLQPAARAAWLDFRARYGAWRTTISAIAAMAHGVGPVERPASRRHVDQQWKTAHAGMTALDGILGSASPVLTGEWIAEPPGITPPLWRRSEMAQDPYHHAELRRIERAERDAGTTVTTYLVP